MQLIVKVPNQVLTKTAQSVSKIDKSVLKIIKEMKQQLLEADNPKGVGLAAPQIGRSLRIFLMKPTDKSPLETFINPVIIKKSTTMVTGIPESDAKLEGCLSIPKIWGTVTRHKTVTLKYLDETGNSYQKTFHGFKSVIVQHEMDHLDGILFTKRVIEQNGKLYQPTVNTKGEEVLESIDI